MRTPDERKAKRILSAMRRHPDGTYVSEVARETKISKSTVSFLLSGRLADKIETVIIGGKGLFKIVRLRKTSRRK